jgi:hypothetical protein
MSTFSTVPPHEIADSARGDEAKRHHTGLALDLGDLRPLQAQPGHQPFLAEDEGIDILGDGRGRQRFRDPGIHHGDTRADADLEALVFVEIPEGLVGHEEQRVLKVLHTGLCFV